MMSNHPTEKIVTPPKPIVSAPEGDGVPPEPSDAGVIVAPARTIPHRILRAVGVVALVVLLGGLALDQLASVDFWWQLRLGQYISELHEVPTTDPFTLTAKGNPYIDSHWLFQVGLWHVYLLGGINGVILGVALVALATWFVVARTHRRGGAYGTTLLVLGLGMLAASERYIPRPDLLSLAFLALTGLIVARFRTVGGRGIFALPVLHLIWVNSHGLWILGPVVIGIALVVDAVLTRVPAPRALRVHAMRPWQQLRLAIVLGLMLPLSFATPQPVAQALYPFTLFREIQGAGDWVASSVTELAAPFATAHWPIATWAFVLLGAFTVLSLLVNWRRIDPVDVVLTGAFAYLALTARRNMALFAVVAAPVAVRQWGHLSMQPFGPRWTAVLRRVQTTCAVVAILGAFGCAWGAASGRFARHDGYLAEFGLGINRLTSPGRLGDFIEATQTPGPLWNTPGLGGYLTWRFWPRYEVFIDGRWEVYGQHFLEAYGRTIRDPAAWDTAADAYGMQAAVVFHRLPDYGPLLRHLHTSADWVLCYADHVAVLYVRRTPETAEYVAQYEAALDARALPTALPRDNLVIREDAFRDREHFGRLRRFLKRWPRRLPEPEQYALLANLCFTLEADEAAADLFARALTRDPKHYGAHLALGYLEQQAGRASSAMEHYLTAADTRPWEVEPWLRLTRLALAAGNVPQAGAHAREARKRAPADPRVHDLEDALRKLGHPLE